MRVIVLIHLFNLLIYLRGEANIENCVRACNGSMLEFMSDIYIYIGFSVMRLSCVV